MDSISPVLTELEVPVEQVVALGQEQYYPIVVARVWHVSTSEEGKQAGTSSSYTRFRFTAAERELIAAGADLVLGQPHHGGMMPVSLQLAMPGEYPVQD
jgi:hypothetical protein